MCLRSLSLRNYFFHSSTDLQTDRQRVEGKAWLLLFSQLNSSSSSKKAYKYSSRCLVFVDFFTSRCSHSSCLCFWLTAQGISWSTFFIPFHPFCSKSLVSSLSVFVESFVSLTLTQCNRMELVTEAGDQEDEDKNNRRRRWRDRKQQKEEGRRWERHTSGNG